MKNYYDIVGDGGSNVLEQVEAQKKSLTQSLSEVRNIVAVGSGKGGVHHEYLRSGQDLDPVPLLRHNDGYASIPCPGGA